LLSDQLFENVDIDFSKEIDLPLYQTIVTNLGEYSTMMNFSLLTPFGYRYLFNQLQKFQKITEKDLIICGMHPSSFPPNSFIPIDIVLDNMDFIVDIISVLSKEFVISIFNQLSSNTLFGKFKSSLISIIFKNFNSTLFSILFYLTFSSHPNFESIFSFLSSSISIPFTPIYFDEFRYLLSLFQFELDFDKSLLFSSISQLYEKFSPQSSSSICPIHFILLKYFLDSSSPYNLIQIVLLNTLLYDLSSSLELIDEFIFDKKFKFVELIPLSKFFTCFESLFQSHQENLSYLKAYFLRHLLPDDILIENLQQLSHPFSQFGLLLFLSVRFFPPFPGERISYLNDYYIIKNKTAIGFIFQKVSNPSIFFSQPSIDLFTLSSIPNRFTRKLPSFLPQFSQEILSLIPTSFENSSLLTNALAEISFNSQVSQIPNIISDNSLNYIDIDVQAFLLQSDIKAEVVRFFFNTKSISITLKSGIFIGFCSKKSTSVFDSIIITQNSSKSLSINPHLSSKEIIEFSSSELIIGYFGSLKQIFVCTQQKIVTLNYSLFYFDDPIIFFMGNSNYPIETSPFIPEFISENTPPCSYVTKDSNLVQFEYSKSYKTPIYFYPTLQPDSDDIYFEFEKLTTKIQVNIHISLFPPFFKLAFPFDSNETIFGIFISPRRSIMFFHCNGVCVNGNSFKLPKLPYGISIT
jgi:hypothetical protein